MTGEPYTHAQHAAYAAASHALTAKPRRVQVQKRGIPYCASIADAYTTPSGLDCWVVESDYPERARFTVACKNTRLCDGQGCACGGDL